MNKKLLAGISTLALVSLVSGTKVSAHEGLFVLKNNSVACEGLSVWRDGRYRITGRCAGLVYPYSERVNNYVLWVRDGVGAAKRVGSINLGYFDGQTTDVFTSALVSVEADSSPRQPGEIVIATGDLQPLDLEYGRTSATVVITPLPTKTPAVKPELTVNPDSTKKIGLVMGVVIGIIGAAVLIAVVTRRSK